MATAYTSLLGLALPVTGELSGSWGDTVNTAITSLLDTAISGTTTLSSDADVTLTTSTGVANEARQAILLWTAGGTVTRNITAPAQSKAYFVINKTSSTQSIVIRGAGPTTGVTVLAGTQSLVVWNGVDFVEVASGNVDGPATSTDNAVARFDGTTGKLIQNSVVTIADTTGNMAGVGTLGVGAITTSGALTYGGVTLSNSVTGTGSMVLATSPTLTTPALGTPSALVGTNITGTAAGLTAGNVTTNANLTGAITSTGNATLLGSFSSANLAGALTDETGTGSAVFANSPTFVTPALGTPASGVVTNLTGTASININGTVGATTATTGAFTDLSASGAVTLSGATANGVVYANGSKVLTTGSALTFNGSTLGLSTTTATISAKSTGSGSNAALALDTTGTDVASLLQLDINGSTRGYIGAGGATYPNLGGNNSLFIWNVANGPTVFANNNTEQMRLTSTGLGIGTSSPGAQLDISTTVSATGAILRLSNQSNTISVDQPHGTIQFFSGDDSGTADTVVSSIISAQATTAPNEGYLKFLTGNNTEKLRLDSSGNLGLGVVPSAWAIGKALQVNGASILSTATEMYLSANAFYGASAWTYRQTDFAAQYYQLNGAHVWRTAPSGTAGAAITFTQAMTLNASGNLGIGTSSPATKLDVRGATTATIRVGSTGSGLSGDEFGNLEFYWADEDAPGVKAKIYTKNVGNVGPGGGGAADLLFATMPALGSLTERMRLDSSGNLGLGVTPSAWGVNTRALQMGDYAALNSDTANGAANVSMNAFFNGTNWIYRNSSWPASYYNQSNGLHRWYNAPSGTAGNAISFTQAMTLDASGNLGIGTTSPSASAILDAQSTTKGVRMPNMTTTQKNAIASPAAGLMVFDTTLAKLCVYTGAAWQTITSV
jgi:hypothetical protein